MTWFVDRELGGFLRIMIGMMIAGAARPSMKHAGTVRDQGEPPSKQDWAE